MFYLHAVLLAIIEGITEFLPISSTGHLILAERFLRLEQDPAFIETFTVLIQLPAVASVALYFWKEVSPFRRDAVERARRLSLWFKIFVAFVPAAAVAFLFGDFFTEKLQSSVPVACALLVGGIVLVLIERVQRTGHSTTLDHITYRQSILIGIVQCLALFPGTSRSAATIIGGMLAGATRATAAEFSFLLALPTMVAASGYMLVKGGANFTAEQWLAVAIGSVVSFAVAYASVDFLMRFVKNHSFALFGWYRIVVGLAILGLHLLGR